jgi:hypothetical protein
MSAGAIEVEIHSATEGGDILLGQRTSRAVRRVGVLAGAVALIAFAFAPWASAPEPAYAGPPSAAVLDWNLNAINALVNAPAAATPGMGQPPGVSMLHLAMVQGAVYDAVNMIDGGYRPYLSDLPSAPATASKAAAVATAAHDVLVGMVIVPALTGTIVTRLNDLYSASLEAATAQDGAAAVSDGVAAGAAAAANMLALRANDGRYPTVPFSFTVGTQPGQWRPTSGINDPFAWVAKVNPFLLKSADQFRTKGPHELTSGAYAKEYNEVKAWGGNGTTTPSLRTPEQTTFALFFSVNPVEMYHRAFRGIAAEQGLGIADEARLFAMLSMGGADALIGCWDDKAFWSFWRPVTAIRLGDTDGNLLTAADPNWTPLLTTPPYPDHPSGYNCFTSATMHTAETFFGRGKFTFSLTATVAGAPVTRNYERFTDVIDETVDARILLGIHFRAPDVQGAALGQDVAHWLDKNYFQPAK